MLFTVTLIASLLTAQALKAPALLPALTLDDLPTPMRLQLQRAYDAVRDLALPPAETPYFTVSNPVGVIGAGPVLPPARGPPIPA